MSKLGLALVLAAAMPLAAGCQSPKAADPSTQPLAAVTAGASVGSARDAVGAVPSVFHVRVFVVSVPLGTFSGNEDFWKRIDEQCVDVATHDLLYKNGIRVGQAPMAEMSNFAEYIDGIVPIREFSMPAAPETRDMQIALKTGLTEQVIFHFDRTNTAIGHSYESSENVFSVSFEPALRKPGVLRLTLAPTVRALWAKMRYALPNTAYQLPQMVYPTVMYDLNFRVDLPAQRFLVITPSPEARRPTSVGNAFLVTNLPAERFEQVMIVISDPMPMQQQTAEK